MLYLVAVSHTHIILSWFLQSTVIIPNHTACLNDGAMFVVLLSEVYKLILDTEQSSRTTITSTSMQLSPDMLFPSVGGRV